MSGFSGRAGGTGRNRPSSGSRPPSASGSVACGSARSTRRFPGRIARLRIRGENRPRVGPGREPQPPLDRPAYRPRRRVDGHGRPPLLIEDYKFRKQAATAADLSDPQRPERRRQADYLLLGAENNFIAERIGKTLGDGETGILFLGALHQLDALGPTDIRVVGLDEA